MTPDWAKLIQVFSKATDRMRAGAREYGEYNPATDARNMYREAKEELLDSIVYLGMEWIRLDELEKKYRQK